MPKKATVPPIVELPADSLQVAPIDGQPIAKEPPPPVKKEHSEAKKAALAKMFEALKAKRERQKAEAEAESAEIKEQKQQAKLKKIADRKASKRTPPIGSYVTMRDLEEFKTQLVSILPKTIYKEVPVDRIVPQPIAIPVETVREKVVQVVQPKKISGNDLLDSIFFR